MAGTEIDLPTSSDTKGWTHKQAALMQFAGLARITPQGVQVSDPGVAEAFLAVCRATGLNPFAKQIYAVPMGGKLSIVVGIDGFRLIADRTGDYLGQTPIEWTRDGVTWVTAWLPELQGGAKGDKPAAARIGIKRRGFTDPLYQVVTWDEFGGRGGNWNDRPAHMLGIRAESHAMRKAFPNDLSGLYTPEDAGAASPAEEDASKALIELIEGVDDRAELLRMYHEYNALGMADNVRAAFLAHGGALKVRDEAQAAADAPLEGEVVPEEAPAAPVPAEAATEPTLYEDDEARYEREQAEQFAAHQASRG